MFSVEIKAKILRNILFPGTRTFSSQNKHSLKCKEKKLLAPQTEHVSLGYSAFLFHYVCNNTQIDQR